MAKITISALLLSTLLIACSTIAMTSGASNSASVYFDKLLLHPHVANSLQQVSQVTDVALVEHCAQVCAREITCVAVRHQTQAQQCCLLTGRHQHVEVAASAAPLPLVEVWRLSTRVVSSQCPPDFNLRWSYSRYKLSLETMRWKDAESRCREQAGSKLAELMTEAEIQAVAEMLKGEVSQIFVGGRQQEDGSEPDGGWMWYRSGISIPSDGFHWSTIYAGQPDDFQSSEDVLSWFVNSATFNDFSDTIGAKRFLCECLEVVV